jgi:carboxymethylenebutenolidase
LRKVLAAVVLFAAALSVAYAQDLPPGEADAKARLGGSPRHGEWVQVDAGGGDRVDAWVVYPERRDRAAVVIVIHEIFGLTDWIRAVADQFAAEGFIAVAPDFLSGKGPGGGGTASVDADAARALIRDLQTPELVRRLNAVARYATSLPAALPRYATVGFCWGGAVSFSYAAEQPELGAAVVYYGTSPATDALGRVRAPLLGLYGGDDARVNATVPAARAELERLGRRFEVETYDGAGHAFLRQLDGRGGANLRAARQAWPRTVSFLKETLEGRASVSAAPAAVSIESP